ncbi:MAG: methyltransferase domain-containing protein [Rhizobium sp.]
MLPNQLSSGDVTADRRADYAKMLDESGAPASAAELMEQALERTPGWAAGWFNLGVYREKAGNAAGATAAFERVLPLDLDDLFGAPLMLASLGSGAVPQQPSSLYIERLFDDYAERFDHALVRKLAYSVPRKLAALLAETPGLPQSYRLTADLGCGTGLLGPEIRDRTDRLEGFDLSANMLSKAAEKQVYDLLGIADLSLTAARSGLFGPALEAHRADLITASDVLIYLGNLDPLFTLLGKLAAPGATVAFSVEDAGAGNGFRLGRSLRYAHTQHYVHEVCARYRLAIRAETSTVIRLDAGLAITGLLFIAQMAD